jgi:nucleotide-binding universal stress UspA family protein
MVTFNKWLVGLDNTDMDKNLFGFINSDNKPIAYQELYFLHIAHSVGLTEKVAQQNDLKDGIAKVEEELENKIRKNLPGKDFKLIVVHGNPGKDIIKISKDMDPDLLVLGRKPDSGAEGVIPEELVAVSNCSALLMPRNTDYYFENIVAAIDFSKISKFALITAKEIANTTGAMLQVQHVCMIPSDFRRTGKSYEEYADKQKSIAEKKAKDFFQDIQSEPDIHYTFADKNKTADSIAAFVKEHNADLVIMGSKGRTHAAAVLLGSIAEQTAKNLTDVPLMVIKEKNANLNWLQAMAN